MDEIGEERGKGLDLMVRVPATIERCERLGLDIHEWVEGYLVDVVVAGGGFIPFEMPIREFVDLAEGTETLIYGCLEAYRPAVDELTLRAIAARYWDAGVDGLYLFNFYLDAAGVGSAVCSETSSTATVSAAWTNATRPTTALASSRPRIFISRSSTRFRALSFP